MSQNSTDLIDRIFQLYAGEEGLSPYFGEPITQSEHALQTAAMATREQAAPSLIAAALLHDIGHLLHGRGEEIADRGIDARHERIGAKFLRRHYAAAVTEPIRLHVDAKRYLCARDAAYAASLSSASQQSLNLQGGLMSAQQCESFEEQPFWRQAVRLRRWDDAAKIVGLDVPGWSDYRDLLVREAISTRVEEAST